VNLSGFFMICFSGLMLHRYFQVHGYQRHPGIGMIAHADQQFPTAGGDGQLEDWHGPAGEPTAARDTPWVQPSRVRSAAERMDS